MIRYTGKRTEAGTLVTRFRSAFEDDPDLPEVEEIELPWRLDLANHSPTGLEWGYGGSGPAQLALALLADALGDEDTALWLHQAFKWEVVACLPQEGWVLTQAEIQTIAEQLTIAKRAALMATGAAASPAL